MRTRQPKPPSKAVAEHADLLREIVRKAPETDLAARYRRALEAAGEEVPNK